jgi:hypothetical protein
MTFTAVIQVFKKVRRIKAIPHFGGAFLFRADP